jgi:AAA domain-containing protein/PHP domain-containing protein
MSSTKAQPKHRDGLRFKKLDLHLHTPASRCFGDKNITPEEIVAESKAKGLSGIAVTDHNSGAWIDLVKAVAVPAGLVVFPGVEITCMGGTSGIHLIALFDPQKGKTDIETLLGALGLRPNQFGDITTVVQHSPLDVAKIVHERGGLAVLAHADSSKGALEDMRGEQRTLLVKSSFISAAEGTDFQSAQKKAAHKRVVDVLDGTDPVYERHLAVYQASDNPTGLGDGNHGLAGIGTRCSYFKLDSINLDGLRQCFVDPEVRIRQDFEFADRIYPYISKIEVKGGFLDAAKVEFHSGLNSILGAKGTGKSLLIEFLRFALNQEPSNREVHEDHYSKLESRLQFIFTTHSSSVAVASDSDKFIILEGGATHSEVLFSGSMDHSPVSQKVCAILPLSPARARVSSIPLLKSLESWRRS